MTDRPADLPNYRKPPIDEVAIAVQFSPIDGWHTYVYQRIQEILSDDEDYPEFVRPTSFVINRAWNIATKILRRDAPTPSVVPSDEGAIVLVWHKARWDLEIEIGIQEETVWAHDRNTGAMFSGSLEEQLERVSAVLEFLAWH